MQAAVCKQLTPRRTRIPINHSKFVIKSWIIDVIFCYEKWWHVVEIYEDMKNK